MKQQDMRYDIPDSELLAAIGSWSHVMTYVARNILSKGRPYLGTPQILRQLKRLERGGKVIRVPTTYQRQNCWQLVKAA